MRKYTLKDAVLSRILDYPIYFLMCWLMCPYVGEWASFFFFLAFVTISAVRGEGYCNAENIAELHKEIESLKKELAEVRNVIAEKTQKC